MTEELSYKLKLVTGDDPNVQEIDDFLQNVLLDLYEQGQIEQIKVTKDGYTRSSEDEDIREMIKIIDSVESSDLQAAIDMVNKMERFGDSNE